MEYKKLKLIMEIILYESKNIWNFYNLKDK